MRKLLRGQCRLFTLKHRHKHIFIQPHTHRCKPQKVTNTHRGST